MNDGFHSDPGWNSFARRVVLVAGVVLLTLVLVCLFYFAIYVWFSLLVAILLAVFLRTLSNWVERWLKTKHPWSLIVVLIALIGVGSVIGWLLAPPISAQIQQLKQQLPAALDGLWQNLQQSPLGSYLPQHQPSKSELLSISKSLGPQLAQIFEITLAAAVGVVVAIFIGLYMAFKPEPYFRGLIRLVPPGRRSRVSRVLDEAGRMLGRWIFGQLLSMLCVGVLVGIGLSVAGIPLPLALAVIAGILDVIPIVGPVIASVPAILLGFTIGPMHAVIVVIIFVAACQIEQHLLMPVIHRYAVRLPPALTLFALTLMTTLFGVPGALVATPLCALSLVLVKRFYVEDALGDDLEREP